MPSVCRLLAAPVLLAALATACTSTKVVPPSPTVVAPSPTVRVVAPSPTVIVLEPTPTPTSAPTATLVVSSVVFVRPERRVVMDVTLENTGPSDIVYSFSQFRAIDKEGFTHAAESPYYPGGMPLTDGTLHVGEKVKGQIAFSAGPGTLRLLKWQQPGAAEITVEL